MFLKRENKMDREKDGWRIFGIMAEFVEAFDALGNLSKSVTIFGSAREAENKHYYKVAYNIAQEAVKKGYAVITGGGPGIMEAANKGAHESNGISVGLNILLPFEQKHNPFIKILVNFKHFFCKESCSSQIFFSHYCYAWGFGTLDEMFEALTLRQTKKIENIPIVLVGKEYWAGLLSLVKTTMYDYGYISLDDTDLVVVDDYKEVFDFIESFKK
jgi:hypothetical protein